MFRNLVFFFAFAVLSERSSAQSRELGSECTPLRKPAIHITRPGDQVGQVLFDLGLGPLWGKGRLVEKTLKLNRMKSDRDLIYRQNLVLPLQCEEDLKKFKIEESSQYYVVLSTLSVLPATLPPQSTAPRSEKMPVAVSSNKLEWWTTFQAEIVYRQIKGKDRTDGTSGQLSSNADPAVTMGLHMKSTERWTSSALLYLESLSIIPSEQGVSVNGTPLLLLASDVRASYEASSSFFVNAGLRYEEHPTYKAASGSGIELKTHSLTNPVFGFGLKKEIDDTQLLSQFSIYLNENSGWRIDLSLKPQRQNNLFCSMSYEDRTLQTQFLQQEDKKMSLGCGWEFR